MIKAQEIKKMVHLHMQGRTSHISEVRCDILPIRSQGEGPFCKKNDQIQILHTPEHNRITPNNLAATMIAVSASMQHVLGE